MNSGNELLAAAREVVASLRARGFQRADAEDAVGRSMLDMLERRPAVRSLGGWLWVEALGRACDARRRARRHVSDDVLVEVAAPGPESRPTVDEAFASVGLEARDLLEAYYAEGRSLDALTGRYLVSRATIAKRLAEARADLAEALTGTRREVECSVVPSTACARERAHDLAGRVFGLWTALEPARPRGRGRGEAGAWRVRCACGTERVVGSWRLRHGKTLSCGSEGCYRRGREMAAALRESVKAA